MPQVNELKISYMALKIIQLLQKPQLRGAEIFACQLSEHLRKQGHEVLMVSIFKGDAELPFYGKMIHLGRPLSKRLYDRSAWKEFCQIIQEFEPDIIQANAADTLKFAVSSKLLYRWHIPIVFRNANKMGDFIDNKLKWYLNKFYLSKVDHVISVSNECRKDFGNTFNFPCEKLCTIEIGVEKKHARYLPKDLEEIFNKGRVLTHIGGFVPEKNHLSLLNIFKGVLKDFPDLQLLLIGKGRLQGEIMVHVQELGINRHVHFLNYRKDVLNILSHSSAFVMPSLIEGLPAVILEAMYCSTPVVANNVGGVGEVVINGQTGWLVEKGDEAGFIAGLQEVLKNGEESRKRAGKAKKLVYSKFMNQQIAKRFAKVYEQVLEGSMHVLEDKTLAKKEMTEV